MIDASTRHIPLRLEALTEEDMPSSRAAPAAPTELAATDSPRKEKRTTSEFPSLRPRLVLSPRAQVSPSPQRLAPVEIRAVKPLAIPVDDPTSQSSSPRKALKARMDILSDAKNKVEDIISPKARVKHLFEGMDWLTLTNSRESRSGENRFSTPTIAPESPPRDPLSGAKRKALDDPEPRDSKRVRFATDENYSKASESATEGSRGTVPAEPSKMKEIDRLAAELKADIVPPRPPLPVTGPASSSTAQDDSVIYPFKPVGLSKAVLRAREKGQPWYMPAGSVSASGSLQLTLKQLRESNQGKIDEAACEHLHELFSLLPAGAIAGTEVFRKGLNRSIRELALTTAQWDRIEALHKGFDQLDISRNPESMKLFKGMLRYIIAVKDLMAAQQQIRQT